MGPSGRATVHRLKAVKHKNAISPPNINPVLSNVNQQGIAEYKYNINVFFLTAASSTTKLDF